MASDDSGFEEHATGNSYWRALAWSRPAAAVTTSITMTQKSAEIMANTAPITP